MDHGTCFRCEFPIRFHPDEDVDATYLRSCLTSVLCTGSDFIQFLMIRQWAALEEHTEPPYTLTLKSNGCIIFIGALTPSKLLITSKHSLGKCPDTLLLTCARLMRCNPCSVHTIRPSSPFYFHVLYPKQYTCSSSKSSAHPTSDSLSLLSRDEFALANPYW